MPGHLHVAHPQPTFPAMDAVAAVRIPSGAEGDETEFVPPIPGEVEGRPDGEDGLGEHATLKPAATAAAGPEVARPRTAPEGVVVDN